MSLATGTAPLIDDELVRAAFEPHLGTGGAHFLRPMHLRLLRRLA